jgi:hypothetical protein
MHLNRKADRRGRIALGRVGRRGLAALLGRGELWPVLEPAPAELEADGCVRVEGDALQIAEFVEAQEAVSSGRARQRKYIEGQRLARDEASALGDAPAPGDESSPPLTKRQET